MSRRFDLITQQLLGRDLIDCSAEELKRLTEQYPYFAPAQFALLKKLKQTDNPEYKTQVQKAILYYHNPFLFDVFMNEEHYQVHFDTAVTEQEQLEETIVEHDPEINVEEQQPATDPHWQIDKVERPALEDLPTADITTEELIITSEPIEVSTNSEPDLSIAQALTEDEQIATEIVSEPAIENNDEEKPATEIALPKLAIVDEKVDEKALAFEPYHTVDYFASQGIKLSQEEATKDKFGKQLKSFTEWLKTMKKLPVVEQQTVANTTTDKKVENMAAHSVEKAEIVTETMAEVWAKQGNREKALEIYQQLSLLNPSKRAYFAAKIDSLK